MKNPVKVAAKAAAPIEEKAVRAHQADGKFKADDPKTPDVNEAFHKPKNKKSKEETVIVLVHSWQQEKVELVVNGKRRVIPVGVEAEIPVGLLSALDDSSVDYEVVVK